MVGYVYILANKTNEVLYVGATKDLILRVKEHKTKVYPNSFTARYRVFKLVYWEVYDQLLDAFERERYIKHMERWEKEILIEKLNPEWKDLSAELTK